jgi:hypothetical protein
MLQTKTRSTNQTLVPIGSYQARVLSITVDPEALIPGSLLVKAVITEGDFDGQLIRGYFPPQQTGQEVTLEALSAMAGHPVSADDLVEADALIGAKVLITVTHKKTPTKVYFNIRRIQALPEAA